MNLKLITKKYKFVLLVLIILTLIIAGCFIFQKMNQTVIVEVPSEENKIVIPARPQTFIEGRTIFIDTVKLARIAILKEDEESAQNYTEQAFILWRDIVNEFINTPPTTLVDSENWVTNLSSIFTSIQEADQLSKNSEFQLAAEKLDQSRIILNSINNVDEDNQTENKLFALFLLIKKIDTATSLAEAKSDLDDLKLAYTDIKNISNDEQFKTLCQDFEIVLSSIDNSSLATFPKNQIKLMPAFVSIYEKY